MIEEVGQEEVLEIWKVVDIQSERKHNVSMFRNYMSPLLSNSKIFTDKGILSPKTVPILRKAIHMRTLYSHVWELACEQNDNKITTLLQIKNFTVAGITSIGKIFNSSHEIQRNESNINTELNLQTDFQRIPKTRGFYKCRVCNGIGYNTAFHKNAELYSTLENIYPEEYQFRESDKNKSENENNFLPGFSFNESLKVNKKRSDGKRRILSIIADDFSYEEIKSNLLKTYPNGIKRMTFYCQLEGNHYQYREDMEGFCATYNTYGYEVFKYLKNLIQKKINSIEIQNNFIHKQKFTILENRITNIIIALIIAFGTCDKLHTQIYNKYHLF
ncbi:hypothetical protein RhiirA5_436262 [Rhizophagus irregularis]|uniref:Uncharacterized protein n=1 Tax=Rhizophagus irregularis TaxID=588596 RepID=A0A2N0NM78_9GLOM|nr:hypothetical protein RhiirA5_436262 [Rhizophagus irregularis]